MYIYITFLDNIPIDIEIHDSLTVAIELLHNILCNELSNETIIGNDNNMDISKNFTCISRWILKDNKSICFGTYTHNLQKFYEEFSLVLASKLLISTDFNKNITNAENISNIIKCSDMSDPVLILKLLKSIDDADIKQACIYLLNNSVDMFDKTTNEPVQLENSTISDIITIINNHIYKSTLINEQIKSLTSVYLTYKMKYHNTDTLRLC